MTQLMWQREAKNDACFVKDSSIVMVKKGKKIASSEINSGVVELPTTACLLVRLLDTMGPTITPLEGHFQKEK